MAAGILVAAMPSPVRLASERKTGLYVPKRTFAVRRQTSDRVGASPDHLEFIKTTQRAAAAGRLNGTRRGRSHRRSHTLA